MGDTVEAVDAYGSATFKVQYDPLSYTKIDGVSVRKRSISASPEVAMPSRGAIDIDGVTYLVGHGAPDYWKGLVIRINYVIQGADGLANLNSIAGELAGDAPVSAYAAVVFDKYVPDATDSSKYPPQYQVFLSGSESAPADSLIKLGETWYIVKETYLSTSGLNIALVNQIADPVFETVTFGSRSYDPVGDSYSSTSSAVKVMRIKWSEHYQYLSKDTEDYQRGDMQVFMLKSVTPKPSDTLSLSDGKWNILSVRDEGVMWTCHVRRA